MDLFEFTSDGCFSLRAWCWCLQSKSGGRWWRCALTPGPVVRRSNVGAVSSEPITNPWVDCLWLVEQVQLWVECFTRVVGFEATSEQNTEVGTQLATASSAYPSRLRQGTGLPAGPFDKHNAAVESNGVFA